MSGLATLPATPAAQTPDFREQGRTNVFLAATLQSAAGCLPVRIRNLTPRGAMIEADSLPPTATAIVLRRGELNVAGQLVWVAGGKAGIGLGATISVRDWLAPIGSQEQQRVDGHLRAFRAGIQPVGLPSSAPQASARDDDLRLAAKLLGRLAEALATDPAVVGMHWQRLQDLDVIGQLLDVLTDRGSDAAAVERRLHNLRQSAAAALAAA